MWIVRIALGRPYTFVVLSLIILILAPLAIFRMPTDIFPNIGIPVVSVVWSYNGLPADEMSQRITSGFERVVSTTVNDIEHIESQSMAGVSVTKLFFQPNVNIDMTLSQIVSVSQTILKWLPTGATSPLILNYNASTVPIIQLALSSDKLSEQELNDLGGNFIRTRLATVQGAALPSPYGGKQRQIVVDLDQNSMQSYGITAQEVNIAIGNQNLSIPAGTQKIGDYEYSVKLNSSPNAVDLLNDIPIRNLGKSILYLRDVAHVRDGFAPQTNIVKVNGVRAVLMAIQKTGSASTLDIINKVKNLIPRIKDSMPKELKINILSDQSLFVKGAINGVVKEAIIASILTAFMILLFIGDWRSTLIIAISIPLSVLSSIIILAILGQTINIMTLGGLALAIGILVDDATVTIENINMHIESGKEIEQAILDGAEQIAIPALVSTLCICIVFIPMFFLTGVAKYLFIPMAEAVIFAMLASYVLSRTLIPTLAKYMLKPHGMNTNDNIKTNLLSHFQHKFERGFLRFRKIYHIYLKRALECRSKFIMIFSLFIILPIIGLSPWLGENFFPDVDSGQIKLHFRASMGLRVEETAKISDQVDLIIREIIPANELESIVDNIGMPNSGINLSYSNSAPIGPSDADIMITLKENHAPAANYIKLLRNKLNEKMPSVTFSFLPADIVSQILNFGLPAPIDLQIIGYNLEANRNYARELYNNVKQIPGVVDARIHQNFNYPSLKVNVDRSRAAQLGVTQRDIATNTLVSLSGSFQTSPAFWLNPKNGVSYSIITQTPQYQMNSLQDLKNIPLASNSGVTILGALSEIERSSTSAVESHYDIQPTIDIYASVQDKDLGGVSTQIKHVIKKMSDYLPKGSSVVARGQMLTMQESFTGLYEGLVFAILLVYLLIVVNFQSWTDPFIIITALPAAIAGIVWMLFLTNTTLSVPALTGAIMCVGVATANSILIVSFARQKMSEGIDPFSAALEAGYVRIRPVLMTATAMIIGMIPMALGFGDGGEQNAPLGRAVIGGLLFATIATLFFVPAVFSLIHSRNQFKNLRRLSYEK